MRQRKPKPSPIRKRLPDAAGTLLVPSRFPPALHERMRVVAAKLNWSVAELVRASVENFCDGYDSAAKKEDA